MGKTRLTLLLAVLCMAAACNEPHLAGANDRDFNESVMAMMRSHSVEQAQAFGRDLAAARASLGADYVRGQLAGMSYEEACRFLDSAKKPASVAP